MRARTPWMQGGSVAAVLAMAALASGCGGSDSAPDAGPRPDSGADAGLVIPGPQIPWLAADGTPTLELMRPCATGWRETVLDSGATTCEPYPEMGPDSCASGEAHFPGAAGCAPVGAACPTGDFPDGLPDDGTVKFVLAGATGGDGTRAAPFGLIADALAVAAAGNTIAVGRGHYDEILTLRAGTTLRGACAAATVIASTASDARAAILNVASGGVVIRDLQIGASNRVGIAARGTTADVTIDGVVVDGAAGSGLAVLNGAHAAVSGLVVRQTRSAASGAGGRGVDVELAALELDHAIIEANTEAGIFAGGAGASLTLADVVVRDTRSRADGGLGRGVNLQDGAQSELTRVLVERNREVGIFTAENGTATTLTDVIVRDTEGRAFDGSGGRGLVAQHGATLSASRVVLRRNYEIGLFIAGLASATVDDLLVSETHGHRAVDPIGRALVVQDGAVATVSHAILELSEEAAVTVAEWDTTLTLSDAIVRDTASRITDGAGGRGLSVQDGALLDVSRALFDRNREVGVFAYGEGAAAQLTDVVVRDTMLDDSGGGGIGAGAYLMAGLDFRRFLITRAAVVGVQLAADGAMDLHDGQVSSSPIGVNLQLAGFDVGRLQDHVAYRDNERDLDTDTLPVPDPTPHAALTP